MDNLEGIIDKIEKEINEKDTVKEQVLRLSRTIIINCRKSIQKMHQNKFVHANQLINKTSTIIKNLYETSKKFPDISSAGYVENAAQEYVEATCLYNILHEQNIPTPEMLNTSNTSYLMGLCDVVGELRRKTLDTILKGDYKKAYHYLGIMEEIYDAILRFDYPSSLVPIKRKQDVSRNLIEKTRGELAVASCEQRIEFRTEEFKGLLESVRNTSRNEKK